MHNDTRTPVSIQRRRGAAIIVATIAALVVGLVPMGGSTAEAAPAGLRVEAESPRSGYDRDLFNHWIDADGDGCDTRDEVLIAESVDPVNVGPGCAISGGRWVSLFDGVTTTDPSTFDVDHMVPLAEAWDSGAWAWDAQTREAFANDLTRASALIAVSASSNRSKGDQDPAEWQPPQAAADCRYATAWVEVKIAWNLSADPAEASALDDMLSGCDGTLPPGGTFVDDNGSVHEPMIEAIAAAGITGGCTQAGNLYCPRAPVSRAQMATFLTRTLDLPAATRDHFSDDNGNTHEDSINRVADAGIAGGTGPGVYNPGGQVTRAQMATFLGRAADLDPVGSGPFTDVAGNTHLGFINAIAEANITAGCNPGGTRYCPSEPVSRDQMATFLGRAFGLTPITPPPPPTTTTTTPPPTTTQPTGCSVNGSKYITANGVCIDQYDANGNGDINCGELPAAARPVTVKNPGDDPYGLDADGDGVGCES